ncbi:MAG: hypothetical protein ACYCSB_09015 [bacterium]
MAFRFQNIMSHRKTILDKKYLELSVVQRKVASLNLKIFDVQNSIESYKKAYPVNILNVSDIYDYNVLDLQFKSLKSKLIELLKAKELTELELEEKKTAVVKAKIEFEKIDKLREKYLAVDKMEQLKYEEAVASDFASNRFNRQ